MSYTLQNVDCDAGFILYAQCCVTYYGRAASFLEHGNYVIIHKPDGSLLIHGSAKNPPKNYQGPKSKLSIDGNFIISTRKNETIKINISNIISYSVLDDWSDKQIVMSKTEKELVRLLHKNIDTYIKNVVNVQFEYQTDVGFIDMLCLDNAGIYHIIEAKRGTASLNNCSQLNRYVECLAGLNKEVRGYIASPNIAKTAFKYLDKHGHNWIDIQFENQLFV